MSRYDDAPETAEADLRRASDESIRVGNDLDRAWEVAEEFERQLDAATTADERAHLEGALRVVESEIAALEQDLASAEEALKHTNEYWFDED